MGPPASPTVGVRIHISETGPSPRSTVPMATGIALDASNKENPGVSTRKTRAQSRGLSERTHASANVMKKATNPGAVEKEGMIGANVLKSWERKKAHEIFMLTGLPEACHTERLALVSALDAHPESTKHWRELLDHIHAHQHDHTDARATAEWFTRCRERLFRRAQELMVARNAQTEGSVEGEDEDLVAVWLMCAKASAQTDPSKSKKTYAYMNAMKIGLRCADMWVGWATLQAATGEAEEAKRTLRSGLDKQAQPEAALNTALKTLEDTGGLPQTPTPSLTNEISADTTSPPPAPVQGQTGKEEAKSGKVKNGVGVEPLPDYIKDFDFKKLMESKKAEKAAAASAAAAPVKAKAKGPSQGLRAAFVRTGLRSSGPMRVARVPAQAVNEDDSDDLSLSTPKLAKLSGDGDDDTDTITETVDDEDLSLQSKLPMAGSACLVGSGLPLETVNEQSIDGSFESTRTLSDRRSSNGSTSSSTNTSSSSVTQHGASTPNDTSLGDDETAVVFANEDNTTKVLPSPDSADDNDNTGVVFKSSGAGGSRVDDDENTAVLFKTEKDGDTTVNGSGDDPTLTSNLDVHTSSGSGDNTEVVFQRANKRKHSQEETRRHGRGDARSDEDEDDTAVVFRSKKSHERRGSGDSDMRNATATIEVARDSAAKANDDRGAKTSHSPSRGGGRRLRKHRGYTSDQSEDDEESDSEEDSESEADRRRRRRRQGGDRKGSHGSSSGLSHADYASDGAFGNLFSSNSVVRVGNEAYFKIGVLGKGGSSKVYRVISERGEILALKRVKLSSCEPKAVESFKNEIALMERLKGSPAIVTLKGSQVNLTKKTIFMVMECGETDLNGVLQRHQQARSLSANFVRLAWQQMLEAVKVIHDARIVHGDLKPANFLFVQGHLKLIDFGIARAITNDTTNIYRESQVGTVNYMSPEAIKDNGSAGGGGRSGGYKPCMKLGRASDIWSLGCILYQMVYGRTPFAHIPSLMQKLMCIIDPSHEISFPELQDHTVVQTIKSCLQREPSKRPSIAGPNGLLSHPFLQPHAAPAASKDELKYSTVQAIVRATVQECGLDVSKTDNLTHRVHNRIKGLAPPTGTQQQRRQPTRGTASSRPAPTASSSQSSSPAEASRPISDMQAQIQQQRDRLRKAEDSVAAKYMKPRDAEGADPEGGVFSQMRGSDLLARNMENRRSAIAPSDDTMNNTYNWQVDATESWQL